MVIIFTTLFFSSMVFSMIYNTKYDKKITKRKASPISKQNKQFINNDSKEDDYVLL